MKRPFFPDAVADGFRRPSRFAPLKALFYASALTGLVGVSFVLEGIVMLGDAVEALRNG